MISIEEVQVIPDHIKDNIAPDWAAKRDTKNPCCICGWSAHMQIHRNPSLIGSGGPYHDYRIAPPERGLNASFT